MDPILVTGAAGGAQGSTGRKVAEILLERGQSVRALVRTDDDPEQVASRVEAEVSGVKPMTTTEFADANIRDLEEGVLDKVGFTGS
jgi:uncharacterized protein YbjT (DUF2867 family)